MIARGAHTGTSYMSNPNTDMNTHLPTETSPSVHISHRRRRLLPRGSPQRWAGGRGGREAGAGGRRGCEVGHEEKSNPRRCFSRRHLSVLYMSVFIGKQGRGVHTRATCLVFGLHDRHELPSVALITSGERNQEEHTDESTAVHRGRAPPPGACQHCSIGRRSSAGGSKKSSVKLFPQACRSHTHTETCVRTRLVDASLRQFPLTGGRLTKEAAISSTQRNQTAHLKSTIHCTPLFEGLP